MSRVLAFGGALMDFVPAGDGWRARPGGSAWNVALGLAALGEGVAFAGSLGSDPFAERLGTLGEAAGLDLTFAPRVDAPTALSVVHRGVGGQPDRYAFYAQGGADSAFTGVAAGAWAGAHAAYFGGVTLLREPAAPAFLACAQDAARRGLTVLYDPNFRPAYAEEGRRALWAYLPHTTHLKVSHEDVLGLLPGRSVEDGVAELRRAQPGLHVLLTLGEAGARLFTPQGEWVHPGYAVTVADTVGAGDACAAGWLRGTVAGPHASPAHVLAFALACGALACTRPGAHAPTLDEVQQFMDSQT
ncbi:fructokinase [Deinococcus metalli]|uniref:Fructokinase n=1 Tax=Deinococcus metalli TaxID=1141878 RepID=A0A7W8NTA5_9DEIO|nr:carbohydrate kinase [Deinococcus metalli]MBB5377977.1 fructokinase [Deinococcus metalli]GHF53494.1 fructokinase [Deinococcus metalli]